MDIKKQQEARKRMEVVSKPKKKIAMTAVKSPFDPTYYHYEFSERNK
jgi:hypothetical protein